MSNLVNKFSIIVPTFERGPFVERAINSVMRQTYPFWELIVVDDGSTDDTEERAKKLMEKDDRISYIKNERRMERCRSRNKGMKAAKNDWICWLDSDDEYVSTYLEHLNWAINEYPDYKVFHFRAIFCWFKKHQLFHNYEFEETEKGFKHFNSGHITSGQFIFHKSLLDEVGYLPDAGTCYDLADKADIPGYSSKTRTLGNPWGEDYYMFYKLTRENKSKFLPFILYIHYKRRSGYNEDFDTRSSWAHSEV